MNNEKPVDITIHIRHHLTSATQPFNTILQKNDKWDVCLRAYEAKWALFLVLWSKFLYFGTSGLYFGNMMFGDDTQPTVLFSGLPPWLRELLKKPPLLQKHFNLPSS